MPRLFIDSTPQRTEILITGQEARYALSVLRLKKGDALTLIDPLGGSWTAEITSASGKGLKARVLEKLPPAPEPPLKLVLIQGILKAQKMDLVIQKAVELGISSIAPVITERTVVSDTRKLPRWRSIAREASRQSGRADVPPIAEPAPLRDFLMARSPLKGVAFWEESAAPAKEVVSKIERGLSPKDEISVLVGPEGGLSPDEAALANECGLFLSGMGRRILRAETAAIAATAILEFALGGMADGVSPADNRARERIS